jgi:hypothetical protein
MWLVVCAAIAGSISGSGWPATGGNALDSRPSSGIEGLFVTLKAPPAGEWQSLPVLLTEGPSDVTRLLIAYPIRSGLTDSSSQLLPNSVRTEFTTALDRVPRVRAQRSVLATPLTLLAAGIAMKCMFGPRREQLLCVSRGATNQSQPWSQ